MIKLSKLEGEPNPDDVVRISGDTGLIHTVCEECETEIVPVVELGEECYEKNVATICRDCLLKALDMINGEKNE